MLEYEKKSMGRPPAPESERKEQHNIRIMKVKEETINAILPGNNFPQKILAIIDDWLKKYSDLFSPGTFDEKYMETVKELRNGVKQIAYENKCGGEYGIDIDRNFLKDFDIPKRITKEWIIEKVIPVLKLDGYSVQIFETEDKEIFDVRVFKEGMECLKCKEQYEKQLKEKQEKIDMMKKVLL